MLFYGRRGNLPDSALLHPGYNNDVLYSSLRGTKQSMAIMFTTLDCRAKSILSFAEGLAMTVNKVYTQPVGLGKPPYLVIGFIGPVFHILNTSF